MHVGKILFRLFSFHQFQMGISCFYYLIYGNKTTKDLHTNVTRKFLSRSCLKWKLHFSILKGGFQGPLKIKRHFYCCVFSYFDDRAFVLSPKSSVDTKYLCSTRSFLLDYAFIQRKFDFTNAINVQVKMQ